MGGMDQVDVSRLSVAECLALADKQDTDREETERGDPVIGILERIAKSAAGVITPGRFGSLALIGYFTVE